jgi:lysophospholipase L1-like esterase
MKYCIKNILFVIALGLLVSFQKKSITLFMAGDSTMSIKKTDKYPETGWGMPFEKMFNETVKVDNRAANGRSTKTFISEGKWRTIIDDAKEGDFVMIQFGHNDQSKDKEDRYTSPEEYKRNLITFIAEVRSKKAIPILLTPIVRRRFDKEGKFYDVHGVYPNLVREVAKEQQVLLIDMHQKTEQLLIKYGKEESKKMFLHLDSAQHINYPTGKKDDTHLNEYGAQLFAELAKEGLIELNIELSKRLK